MYTYICNIYTHIGSVCVYICSVYTHAHTHTYVPHGYIDGHYILNFLLLPNANV